MPCSADSLAGVQPDPDNEAGETHERLAELPPRGRGRPGPGRPRVSSAKKRAQPSDLRGWGVQNVERRTLEATRRAGAPIVEIVPGIHLVNLQMIHSVGTLKVS